MESDPKEKKEQLKTLFMGKYLVVI